MKTVYFQDLKAHVTLDENDKICHILHTREFFGVESDKGEDAVERYLSKVSGFYKIPPEHLKRLNKKVSFLDPVKQETEFRLYEKKKFFTLTTYCYYQTIHNVPVWRSGMTVTVKPDPFRIVHSDHYGHNDLFAELPSPEIISKTRDLLEKINISGKKIKEKPIPAGESFGEPVYQLFTAPWIVNDGSHRKALEIMKPWMEQSTATRGLFYIYRYDSKERVPSNSVDFLGRERKKLQAESENTELTLALPKVSERIHNNQHYLVAEIIFHLKSKPSLNWNALVEVETGTVLWLRVMSSGVNGLVFTYDPQTSTGDVTMTPDDSNAILNPLRDDVVLTNLNAAMAGIQSLSGTQVMLSDDDTPNIAPPTVTAGSDFDYNARTNNFAAVNAYYHADNLFNVIRDLGFTLAGYFDGTSFPVHLDHRASYDTTNGIERNAFCNGDGASGSSGNGIGMVGYCLSDLTDTTNPLGRAVDKWVTWHEIGGHGSLWDHVNSPNFGFAHSAGDSLAAFQNDPESQLRGMAKRFQYAPFRDLDRWFNRAVADGWGWGGTRDSGGYNSEQILATTLFRFYQSLGGDSTDVAKRWYASRVATYLVLNAIGHCSVGDNPASPEAFYNKLVLADADDWTSEGFAGGAYNKVLRWAFEKQGLWRTPGSSATAIGAPPAVDLYLDDGRGGEYTYQAVHWENTSVWNRAGADGGLSQDPGVAGVPSFAYVRVKNRGTTNANGTVRVFHCKPGAGLTWPADFVQAEPLAGLPTGTVLANNGNSPVIGPFNWTPNVNTYGHDCLLAIVEAEGDPCNIQNLLPTETIEEWRLVPHDNNIGQRNVVLVPAGNSGEDLLTFFKKTVFIAGNNLKKTALMEIRITMPPVMKEKGWSLKPDDIIRKKFRLKPGEKVNISLSIIKGQKIYVKNFTKRSSRDIRVCLFGNGILMGGMTYRLDFKQLR